MQILLVPTTEFLLTSWDRDSNARYSDLVGSDEFLGSHVLRIPANATAEAAVAAVAKGAGTTRDGRGKAKQLSTVNGRTVIVKEAFVYSNKGAAVAGDVPGVVTLPANAPTPSLRFQKPGAGAAT